MAFQAFASPDGRTVYYFSRRLPLGFAKRSIDLRAVDIDGSDDRLVITDLASVWRVHEQASAQSREVTALLVRFRTPLAAVTFPPEIGASAGMQAASPARELTRLLGLIGTGIDVFNGFAAVLLMIAALSVFVVLFRNLEEQRGDLALMRSLGATRARLAMHLLGQGVLLGAAGGAAVGALLDKGIQKDFIKEVGESMGPNSSALFIIVREADPTMALAALRPYKGKVIQSSLPPEAEEELRRILSQRIE